MRIYQPEVIKNTDFIIEGLIDVGFFIDREIDDFTFARKYLLNKLTEKYINGELNSDDEIFTEDEFTIILKDIVSGSILYSLKTKGLIESYEDDQTEEVFFLTKEGKDYIKSKLETDED